MRSPPLLTAPALVLGCLALLVWWSLEPGQSVDPVATAQTAATRERERDPADLVQPPVEVAQTTDEAPLTPDSASPGSAQPGFDQREPIAAKEPILIQGRVVDIATGAGVEGCTISLASGERARIWSTIEFFSPREEVADLGVLEQVLTDEDGRFLIELREGEMTGQAIAFVGMLEGWIALDDRHDLLPREVQFGCDLRFEAKRWPPPPAGDITGWLRAEKGSFPANAVPRRDHILLDLVSTELPAIDMRATLATHVDYAGGVTFSFQFEDVPEGEYELTLSSLGNYRWDPTSIRVVPPASGIEFLRFDLDEVLPLGFEVYDLETGETIEDFEARHIKVTRSEEHGVLLHTGPIEAEQFPRDQAFHWSVEADGYAVAYGDEGAFTEADGKRVARVGLKRGWSTRFLLMGGPRGARPQPIFRGEVYLDGRFAGHSDANGGLEVFAEEPPTDIIARYPGGKDSFHGSPEKRRSNVTAIILVEPDGD